MLSSITQDRRQLEHKESQQKKCSSGLGQSITAAWTRKAYSPWRPSESPMPHATVSRFLAPSWWQVFIYISVLDATAEQYPIREVAHARYRNSTQARLATGGYRSPFNGPSCLRDSRGSQPSDRIELAFLLQASVHSDLLVIYLMEGIQWRAGISTVTFYPHQMFALKTR